MTKYILSIDPGATNTKGVLREYTPEGSIKPDITDIYKVKSEPTIINDMKCEIAPSMTFELLKNIDPENKRSLSAIVITSHGATQIPIEKNGKTVYGGSPAYDEEKFDKYHDEFLERFGGSQHLYLKTGSSELPRGINSLQQIYYLLREHPEKFDKTTDFLPLSSYIAFLLSGERYTCHTHLRNHAYIEEIKDKGWDWSQPVKDLGLKDKFPKTKKPFEIYGNIKDEISQNFDIDRSCKIIASGHDTSTVSILAKNYINTGTWICNTAADVPITLEPQMQNLGLVVNADPYENNLRTIMARLGQTKDAYREQFKDAPEDVSYIGPQKITSTIPLAFMEGIGVYPSLEEYNLPKSFTNDPEEFMHSLYFSLTVPEILSSIITSDQNIKAGTSLSSLIKENYKAKDVVIGGNYVNPMPDGSNGTFTEMFRRMYPGKVERFTFKEPTSFAAHVLAVCALEDKQPKDIAERIIAPKEDITYDKDDPLLDMIEDWEQDNKKAVQENQD